MWFRRRRRQPPPVLLPSLDRVSELIERVVALLDEVQPTPVEEAEAIGSREPAAPPERIEQPSQPVAPERQPEPQPEPANGHVLVVATTSGYRLLERDGPLPARGARIELDGTSLEVLRTGPSPLPGDRRRCAFLERGERSESEPP